MLLFRHADRDALYVRLAERWVAHEGEVGHYRRRPPFIDSFTVHDTDGTAQAFTADTYPHVVNLDTAVGMFSWVFDDPEMLIVALPEGIFTLKFTIQAQRYDMTRRGGTVWGRRNAAYTTDATVLDQIIRRIDSETVSVELTLEAGQDAALMFHITPSKGLHRSMRRPSEAIDAARGRWAAWFDAAPQVLPEYQAQYEYAWWVMRAGLLAPRDYLTRESTSPSKIHYVGAWLWDQYFHAIAYRHVDISAAQDQLRVFLDHQQPNGMLPDAIHDEGIVTHLTAPVDADVTKPPFMAWAAWKIYETSGDIAFLDEIYEPLARWQAYWFDHCLDASGLAVYQHPFSSGLDDSPIFDEGMPVVAPDLNTYLVIQAEALAKIAEALGLADEAAAHREQAEALANLIQFVLWDKERGYFHALVEGTKPVSVFTPFHLLPLWTGRLTEKQVEQVVAHLTSSRFWANWPLATVATDDPKFDASQMWRGPIWVNINLLFVEALERVGQHEVARRLRRASLDLIMQRPDIYEYYNPYTAEKPPKSAPIFGWTSAAFIELAIQETRDRAENG